MTLSTKTTIKTYFETGDKPTAGNFSDFIDSCAFLQETSAQTFQSGLNIGGDFTVSGNARIGGIVSANTINTNTLNITTLNATTVSAATGNFTNILVTTASAASVFANTVNAGNVNAAVSASTLSSSGVTALKGSITNDSAAAGYIGEFSSQTVNSGSAVPLTNNTDNNVASLNLTAGDWDVWATAIFTGNVATTVTNLNAFISTTSSAEDNTPGSATYAFYAGGTIFNTTTAVTQTVNPIRKSLSTTTTIYLVVKALFATNTCSAYGTIQARRRR